MDIDVQKLIRGERDTLHDLSNSLVVIQGMSSLILKSLEKIAKRLIIASIAGGTNT